MPNKKRIYFFIVLYFAFVINMQAQNNLMVDGSFEELNYPLNNSSCIDFSELKKWKNPGVTFAGYTRYYNTKSTNKNCSPDYNQIYYQIPKDGVGIVSIYTLNGNNPKFADTVRTYVQGYLLEPLIGGKRYEVKFHVSLANFYGMSVSKIGALLTTNAITFTDRCYLEPQVESNRHLTDTLNWMEIKGEFIAQGGEKHITLGNFRTDADSDTLKVLTHSEGSTTARMSKYTLDDVSVVCLDCPIDEVGVGIVQQKQKPKNVVFNTSTNTLSASEGGLLVIYNMQGAKVLEQNIKQEENIVLQPMTNGVYIWQLQTEKSVEQGKFVVE